MVVNSFNFLIFFVVVFIVYYFLLNERTKLQNWLLLVASYFFYGFASLKAVPILLVATVITFFLGKAISNYNTSNKRKASVLTTVGVCLGIGLLLYFKYLNFFIESFTQFFNSIGLKCNPHTFNIILPIGISFFTFKILSYLIEVHRCKMEVCTDFVAFATYVAFFPTILSGPIDRPNKFIPQIQNKRVFSYTLTSDGCMQILWGMFKKMVIADNLNSFICQVWDNISVQGSFVLLLSSFLYLIQMYTDFSGYSDMAIGVGKILGFRITKNFDYPIFARNIAEYWSKWHISLTGWLTDYVFMPLNIRFRNLGNVGVCLAILINMVLVGLWHGANWTFALFGLYHGLLFIPLIYLGAFSSRKKIKVNRFGLPAFGDFSKMVLTFVLVSFGLVIFRASSVFEVGLYFTEMFTSNFINCAPVATSKLLMPILFFCAMIIFEWKCRSSEYPLQDLKVQRFWKFFIVYFLIIVIVLFGQFGSNQFIYFKF